MIVVDLGIQMQSNRCAWGEVKVYVVLKRILNIVEAVAEGEKVLTSPPKHPRLMANIEVHEVGNLRRTPTDIHIGSLVIGHVFEDLLIPIHIGVLVWICPCEGIADVLLRIERIARTLIPHSLVVHTHVGLSTSSLRYINWSIDVVLNTHPDDRTL